MKISVPISKMRQSRILLASSREFPDAGHVHEELEINLVVKGTAKMIIGNSIHHLLPGTLLWLFPDQPHTLTDRSHDFKAWVPVFTQTLLRDLVKKGADKFVLSRDPEEICCRKLPLKYFTELDQLCLTLYSHTSNIVFNKGSEYLLALAWDFFLDSPKELTNKELSPIVKECIYFIENGKNDNSVKDLAKAMNCSVSFLSRHFKKETGISISDFRSQSRLKRFFKLVNEKPCWNLLHLSLGSGFGSYPQFHRVFTKFVGQNPATWIKERR